MATDADVRFRALALSMLAKYGTSASYTHRSSPAYDANTSAVTATSTVVTPNVFVSEPSYSDLRNGVLATEKTCLLAGSAVSFEPTAMDTITVDGLDYRVRPVKPIYSGTQVALWILGLSR